MSLSWLLLGIALALIRLGSPGSLRLAGIAGDSPADGARWRVDLRGAESAGPAAAVITGGLVALRTGPALGLAAALGVSTATTLLGAAGRRLERRRRQAAAALAVHVVRAEIDAGADSVAAVRAAADGVFAADLGAMADALAHARDPTGDVPAELWPLAHAMRVCIASGAPASTVLEAVSDQLQDGLDRQSAVTAALAGARSSAMLLAVLPLLGIALGAGLGVNPVHVLLGSSAGHALVFIGVALECVGLRWTARLASSAEGAVL